MKVSGSGLFLSIAGLVCLSGAMAFAQDTAGGDAAPRTLQLVPAHAYLNKTIDAKKAKQGDPVTAKLQDDVKGSDAQALPKGTLLVGHIDQVQASENKGDSSVQVTFDKAQLKSGQQVPIKATVMQISPPMNAMQQAGAEPVSGGAPMAGGGGGSMPAGGGGNRGPSGSGSAPAASGPPAPMSSASGDPQQASQPNGVDGVVLQSDIHQSNSGTFVSKGRNVHLVDGTQMQFAIAVVPATAHMQ
jgi:hypothetical protein